MATTIIGKIGTVYKNEWSATDATYNRLDEVSYQGSTYRVILPTGFVPVGTLPTNETYFKVSARGVDITNIATRTEVDTEKAISTATTKTVLSKNKVNTSKIDSTKYYSTSIAGIKENSSQPTLGVTDFLPVTPSGSSVYSGAATAAGAGYYDINKQSLSLNASYITLSSGYRISHPNNNAIAFIVLNVLLTASASDLMFEDGTVKTTYEAHHDPVYKLDTSSLNLPIVEASAFTPVKSDIDAVINLDYDKYGNFTGTSYLPLPVTHTLNAIGDYVEFSAKFSGSSNDGLGFLGTRVAGSSANKLGFYVSGEIGLRGNVASDAYARWVIPGGTTGFKTYKIEVVADGWALYIDGVLLSTKPKLSPLLINTIGNAYIAGILFFKGGVKYLTIHTATTDTTITDFASASGSIDITSTVSNKPSSSSTSVIPKLLYSFNPTGGINSAGIMSVYVSFKDGSYYYSRFDVEHIVDSAIRADLWRIRTNEVCVYDPAANTMAGTGKKLLHSSENEAVINIVGKTDHTGGVHGDEISNYISFLANNQPLSIGAAIPLTACNTFKYIQKSNLLDTDNTTVVNVIEQSKTTEFVNSGYETESGKKLLVPLNVAGLYAGLFCVAADVAEKAFTENNTVVTAVRGDSFIVDELYNNTVNYYSETNKLGAKVNAVLTKVIKGGLDKTTDTNILLWLQLWDRTTDLKFYLKTKTAIAFAVGDYIYSKGWISFYRKA